jgi:hypothetical protein
MRVTLFFVLFALVNGGISSTAEESTTSAPLRVGGTYLVKKIQQSENSQFKIIFESPEPTGKFDRLILETDHVHVAVTEGASIRLSAEIAEEKGKQASVSQVLLYLPNPQGDVPVFLLSRKRSTNELGAAPYLKMHNPMADYLIF